jgi:putative restriction endonuclease
MSRPPAIGLIPGVPSGAEFDTRLAVLQAGLHRDTVKGISFFRDSPTEAIVLSGGYEDDIDLGSTILYTGEGGNANGQQVADQSLVNGNLALYRSYEQQTPVRVIRKVKVGSTKFYQYAGLFRVIQYRQTRGKSGFLICQFVLEEWDLATPLLADASAPQSEVAEEPASYEPLRRQATVLRLVRDSTIMSKVKRLHRFACQVCGIVLDGPKGPYAEAAHIRPLGSPHHGPDKLDNVLCLCPNHHVLFDLGAWSIAEDGNLLGLAGRLRITAEHLLNEKHIAYHRTRIYVKPDRR